MYNKAYFAGGCFWCTEAIFIRINGVNKVMPGYMGGKLDNPSYKEVCSGQTGHAEGVKVIYDPKVVSYETLLLIFFTTHDPTTLISGYAIPPTPNRGAPYLTASAARMIDEGGPPRFRRIYFLAALPGPRVGCKQRFKPGGSSGLDSQLLGTILGPFRVFWVRPFI